MPIFSRKSCVRRSGGVSTSKFPPGSPRASAQRVRLFLGLLLWQVAQPQPALAQFVGFSAQDGAVFEEVTVASGQFEEVCGKVIGPVVGDDAVEGFGELQQRDGEGALLRSG